jgi:Protein of unknown function (DUF3168)
MSLDARIGPTLRALVASARAYPDVPPPDVVAPYITWQQVGGQSINFVDTATAVVGKRNARVQVEAWADRRSTASTLMASAEDALKAQVQAFALGAAVSLHEPDLQLYGSRQDFSIWY